MYNTGMPNSMHIELTSRCNAACPMCARTESSLDVNQNLPLSSISLEDFLKFFSEAFLNQLQSLTLCGNYGDPAASPHTLGILEHFRSINQKAHVTFVSNGSLQSEDWWENLARFVSRAVFSIDGLENTNGIYRIGTSFQKIEKNLRAFVSAGGKARWDFIVFAHNEHQVEEARAKALEIGVEEFRVKKTGRFFDSSQLKMMEELSFGPSDNATKIRPPKNVEYRSNIESETEARVNRYGSVSNYLASAVIDCRAQIENSVYVSAEGLVFPCCWLAGQMYPWYKNVEESEVFSAVNNLAGGKESLSLYRNSLNSILSDSFFQSTVPNSWSEKSCSDGKLRTCARTCGKRDI